MESGICISAHLLPRLRLLLSLVLGLLLRLLLRLRLRFLCGGLTTEGRSRTGMARLLAHRKVTQLWSRP